MTQPRHVTLTPKAAEMLAVVTDRRKRGPLLERIEALGADPEVQGKALLGELRGHRSVWATGQRYRIVYRVIRNEVVVLVIGMGRRREGSRRNVYAQFECLDVDGREEQPRGAGVR